MEEAEAEVRRWSTRNFERRESDCGRPDCDREKAVFEWGGGSEAREERGRGERET